MDTISRLIELAHVRAVLDVRCLLAGSTVMDVAAYGEADAAFHFLLEGECTLEVGDKSYPLTAGDAVLLPSSPPHRIRTPGTAPPHTSTKTPGPSFGTIHTTNPLAANGDATTSCADAVIDLFCGHYTFASAAGLLLAQTLPDPTIVSFAQDDDSIRTMCDLMRREAHHDGPGTAAILSSICTALLTMLLRRSTPKLPDTTLWTATTDPRITQVIDAVLKAPATPWPIERLAALATMSRATFLRHFTKSTGTTVGAFLTTIRMMHATDLLTDPALTVAAVATQVGYNSESAFTQTFHQTTGTTPGRFRRQVRSADSVRE
ncbi:MAG: AraC family transcriptional regulator, activator of mtrCDE [Kribbellaceae bacterium]|nr:AraC family transcriptional regulator, activator of mtrCDE [Kribbellaceae bacterium]